MALMVGLTLPAFPIAVRAADGPTYTVRPGDTLASIAAANYADGNVPFILRGETR